MVGADSVTGATRQVAVRDWTCNADVSETCRPRTIPGDGSCTPDEFTYTWSACRWALAPFDQVWPLVLCAPPRPSLPSPRYHLPCLITNVDHHPSYQATFRLSDDDGLTVGPPVRVDPSAEQSVALGIAIHPVTRVIAIVYERVGASSTSLNLALFDQAGRPLQTLVLHVYSARKQAVCDGAFSGDSLPVLPLPGGAFLVAFARVHGGIDAMPDAAVGPAQGLEVDLWERSRLAVATIGPIF